MTQLTESEYMLLTPEQKVAAHADGRLDTLLGVPAVLVDVTERARNGERLTREDIRVLAEHGRHDIVADLTIDRITETEN